MLKNPTFQRGRYLYSLYMGVTPPGVLRHQGKGIAIKSTAFKKIRSASLLPSESSKKNLLNFFSCHFIKFQVSLDVILTQSASHFYLNSSLGVPFKSLNLNSVMFKLCCSTIKTGEKTWRTWFVINGGARITGRFWIGLSGICNRNGRNQPGLCFNWSCHEC